jgi:hypothetical protein
VYLLGIYYWGGENETYFLMKYKFYWRRKIFKIGNLKKDHNAG